jgi:hypothetical protein
MNITVAIPDEIVDRLGGADIARRALEAFGVEEFRAGRLTLPELRHLLGFSTRSALDAFLKARQVYSPFNMDDLNQDRLDLDRLGL